jgi:transcriptional regulator with XRE-family HTH domain|nr:MAG TPA: helix-turn-helix domain protein [Caudoviricetes sp.]
MKGGSNVINTSKLKGRMVEKGITQKQMAEMLGIAPPTVCQKLNNIRPMDLSEAETLMHILDIKPDEFGVYFFA